MHRENANGNPKDQIGRRKAPLHLVPESANLVEAEAMRLGAAKYGPYNWRAGPVSASVYVAAARRHLAQWFDGEDLDPESRVSHLAHVRACMGILIDAISTGNVIDDRPPAGAAARLVRKFTRKAT